MYVQPADSCGDVGIQSVSVQAGMTKPLTQAQRRALEAVRDGLCRRVYSKDGNVYRGPACVGGQALWRLEKLKLIRDGLKLGMHGYAVELTDAGREQLGGL
jgi:hypothetical protein